MIEKIISKVIEIKNYLINLKYTTIVIKLIKIKLKDSNFSKMVSYEIKMIANSLPRFI